MVRILGCCEVYRMRLSMFDDACGARPRLIGLVLG